MPVICDSAFKSLSFNAAFVVAFFAALYISELVVRNKTGNVGLRFQDVQLSSEYLYN